MSLKSLTRQNYVNKSIVNSTTPSGISAPVISSIIICDSNYTNLDDTALSPSGSYVKLIGSGFKTGCTVYFNNETVTATFVSSSEVRIQTPTTTVGAYNLMLFNPLNAGGAIYLNLSVSNFPSYTTSSGSLGTYYEANTISNTIVATGDTPLSYSLYSGSLPSGATLNSDGTITGTSPLEGGSTTYSFVVNVKDAQGQDATRSFSLTINTDPVTWSTPSDNQVISAYEYSPISNVTMSASSAAGKTITYSANTLPGGIALSGNTIYGTNNTVGNTYTRLTATAATTGRTSTRDVIFNINADEVTWSNPSTNTSYSLTQSTAMSNVVLSATSAAGFGVQYAANTLPTGVSISGNTIYGTPSATETIYTKLTATADTTNRAAYRYVTWTVSVASDTYFKNTTLLLSSNTMMQTASFANDNSINNSQLTVVADTKPSNLNPYEPGYYSYYYPALGAYHTFNNPLFNVGPATAVWTVEMWVYPITSGYLFCIGSGGPYGNSISVDWSLITANKFSFFQGTGSSNINQFSTSGTYLAGKWYHIAVSKDASGVIRLFVDGVQDGTATNTTNAVASGTTAVINGANDNNGLGNYGGQRYISNLRFVKDHALYTANFTPSTIPPSCSSVDTLLTCRTNKFEDTSNILNPITIGGSPIIESKNPFTTKYVANTPYYSTYFDGTGDYLTLPNNQSQFSMGTGDFTIEMWVNISSLDAGRTFYDTMTGSDGTGTGRFALQLSTGGVVQAFTGAGSIFTSGGTLVAGLWYHIAYVRISNSAKLYVNGTQVNTTYTDNNNYVVGTTSRPIIGVNAYDSSSNPMFGSISNLRVVKGVGVYTGTFIPPTSPLTATQSAGTNISAITGTQTSLLTCQDSTFKDNSTNGFALTQGATAPNAKPVPVSPFTSSYHSTSFNGSTSYLTATTSSAFPIGTEDFTVEMWLNKLDAWSAVNRVLLMSSTASSMQLWVDASTSQIKLSFNNGATPLSYTASSISTSTWFHLAITRSGNNFTMYINGTSVATGTNSGSFATPTSIIIGNYTSGTSNIWNGLIHNLRIVRGTAIAPPAGGPTAPVTAVSGTSLLTCNSQYIIDESVNAATFTQTGSPKTIPRAPFTQPTGYSSTTIPTTYGSIYFDGTGDYIQGTVQAPGTGDFTMEGWVYFTAIGVGSVNIFSIVASGSSAGWQVYASSNYNWGVRSYSANITTGTGTVVANTWYHVAVVRKSGVITLYLNGSYLSSTSTVYNFTDTQFNAGYTPIGTEMTGYVSDIRYVKGTALYSSNFVPPINTQLTNVANTQLLTCQTNGPHNNYTFKDDSGTNNLITKAGNPTIGTFSPYGDNWSVYFPAAAYTTTAASPITFGASANFTVEGWVNMSVLPASGYYFMMLGSADQSTLMYWSLAVNSSGKVSANWYDGNSKNVAGATTLALGTWYHVSFVATNGVIKIYLNGTSETLTGTTTLTNPTGNASYTMGGERGNHSAVGYFSNVRMYSSAIRSVNFDVPTTPYLPDSTATYLTAQSNRFIDNSVNNRAITVSGAVIQKYSPFNTVTIPKYYSTYFDGTGDYLSFTNTTGQGVNFGTGDFTVELWYYMTNNTTNTTYHTFIRQDTATGGFDFGYRPGASQLVLGAANIGEATASATLAVNTWYHLVVTRSSGNLRFFVNGTQAGTTVSNSYNFSVTGGTVRIGSNNYNTAYTVYGYISNLRTIVGQGLYTGLFTAPTTKLSTSSVGTSGANVAASITGTVSLLTCQDETLKDNSTNLYLITGNADAKPLPFSPFTPTVNAATVYDSSTFGGSMYFDGTGDYISTTTRTPFVSNDYTIECWVYHVAAPNPCWIWDGLTNSGTGPQIFVTNSGSNLYFYKNSVTSIINASITTKLNAWTHYAFCRVGTTVTAYVNGVAVGTPGTDDTTSTTSIRGGFGSRSRDGAEANQAYFSDFRITTGVALYKSNFYPGSTPLTPTSTFGANTYNSSVFISGRSAGILDASRNANLETSAEAKVTNFSPYNGNYYSNYFDGNGDYLTTTNTTAFNMGTGDFTIESWYYPTTLTPGGGGSSDGSTIISTYPSTSTITGYSVAISSTGYVKFIVWVGGTQQTITATTNPLSLNSWNHVAVSKSSGTYYIFVNGQSATFTGSISQAVNTGGTVKIGALAYDTYYNYVTGNISNLRVVKGTALYTSPFSPSTTPLTAISGTSLLTCQSNKLVDNSTNNYTITRNGDVSVKTQNPFQVNSGQSYYFDGTGDYLSYPTTGTDIITGDFTFECWVYPNTTSTGHIIYVRGQAGASAYAGFRLGVENNALFLLMSTNGSGWGVNTGDIGSVPINTWTHVAVTRSGSTVTVYINGQALATTYTISGTLYNSGTVNYVGAINTGSPAQFMNGYISDLRFTIGAARTITVPTSPLLLK